MSKEIEVMLHEGMGGTCAIGLQKSGHMVQCVVGKRGEVTAKVLNLDEQRGFRPRVAIEIPAEIAHALASLVEAQHTADKAMGVLNADRLQQFKEQTEPAAV